MTWTLSSVENKFKMFYAYQLCKFVSKFISNILHSFPCRPIIRSPGSQPHELLRVGLGGKSCTVLILFTCLRYRNEKYHRFP
jgi:hypothetical protein